jgi:hypothetical protein
MASLAAVVALTFSGAAQELPPNEELAPLVLVRIIPMPAAEGRIDHANAVPERGAYMR